MIKLLRSWASGVLLLLGAVHAVAQTIAVRGDIVDADTGHPLAARLYLQGADGKWHFPKSAAPDGSAVRYEKRSGFNTNATEFHTTLSAHPWVAELPPGDYTALVERGKEWLPLTNRFASLPAEFHTRLSATPLPAPYLVCGSAAAAELIGLDPAAFESTAFVEAFSGFGSRGVHGATFLINQTGPVLGCRFRRKAKRRIPPV